MAKKNISVYLSFLLRHRPETIHLAMDKHGWVLVEDLIEGVNKGGRYQLDLGKLEAIVAQDSKGRYRFNADHSKIKACQGHSIPWVEPELEYLIPRRHQQDEPTRSSSASRPGEGVAVGCPLASDASGAEDRRPKDG